MKKLIFSLASILLLCFIYGFTLAPSSSSVVHVYYLSSYKHIDDAANSLNAKDEDLILYLNKDDTMDTNASFDSDVTVIGIPGNAITTTGYTLTFGGTVEGVTGMIAGTGTINFDGPVQGAKNMFTDACTIDFDSDFQAGEYQVWNTSSTVTWNGNPYVNCAWWGLAGDDSTDDLTALRAAFTSGAGGIIDIPPCATRYKITNYLEIDTDNTTVRCHWNNGPIRQDTWGKPVFYVRANDVSILDAYCYSNETRSAIATDMATEFAGETEAGEGTLNAYKFSAGIFLSYTIDSNGHRFYTNRTHVEGFVCGIFLRGNSTDYILDPHIGELECDTVDFGLMASRFNNLTVDTLKGVDLSASQGVDVHTMYITGGDSTTQAQGLTVGQISTRNNVDGDHTVSIKYTKNIAISNIAAYDCSNILAIQHYCTGVVSNITGVVNNAQGALGLIDIGAATIGYCDIVIGNIYIEGPTVNRFFSATGDNVGGGATTRLVVNNCYLKHTGGTALNVVGYIAYINDGAIMELHNPVIVLGAAPVAKYAFDTSDETDNAFRIYNPIIEGIGTGANCDIVVMDSNDDIANSFFHIDPQLIDQTLSTASFDLNEDTGPYNITFLGPTRTPVTMETAQATPIVCYATRFKLTNGVAQNVTDFTRVPAGHRFVIETQDGNTTFVHAANQLEMLDGNNDNPAASDLVEFIEFDGSIEETFWNP